MCVEIVTVAFETIVKREKAIACHVLQSPVFFQDNFSLNFYSSC